MSLVDEEIEAKDMTQLEIAQVVGLKGSAYNAWVDGKSRLSIEQAIKICNYLGWLPAWGIFGEGPKTESDRKGFEQIVQSIGRIEEKLGTSPPKIELIEERASSRISSRRGGSRVEYQPLPLVQAEIANARKALSSELARGVVEIPHQLFAALESLATALHRLDAPQVSICQEVPHRAGAQGEVGLLDEL